MRKGLGVLATVLALAAWPAGAQANGAQTRYAAYAPGNGYFVEYPGGPAAVLLLHENSETWRSISGVAESLQRGGYTVLDLEWAGVEERPGTEVWEPLTAEIEDAVRYAVAHSAQLGIDPSRLAMVGGSRGANLAALTAQDMNAVSPGTIKAVVALSADVNPIAQLERTEAAIARGEPPNERIEAKFSHTYGCSSDLSSCPRGYIERWSPYDKAVGPEGATAPAMLLAASLEERLTASWEDQPPMAEALERKGVSAAVLRPQSGHGFAYMGSIRRSVLDFLAEHDGRHG